MEQLGNILKILFVYDSEGIISDSFLPKPDYRCKDINNNALTHLLVSNGLVATLDQAESLVNTLVGLNGVENHEDIYNHHNLIFYEIYNDYLLNDLVYQMLWNLLKLLK